MKIDPEGVRPVQPERVGPTEATPTEPVEGATPAEAPQGADRIVLSERAQEVQFAREALGKLSPTSPDKLDALKQAVQDGVYEVDAEQLASDMLSEGNP